MKPLRTFFLLALGLFAFPLIASGATAVSTPMLNAVVHLSPVLYRTQSGAARGVVSRLTIKDQSSTEDDPQRYVQFITPGVVYRGYRIYFLPENISPASVTSLQLKVNYKGPLLETQVWSWYLYEWGAKKWVKIGRNAGITAHVWKLLTFKTTSPQRFIHPRTGKILVLLGSNNASKNAKLDYESVYVGYNFTPTPTQTQTPTITPTPSATPTAAHFAVIGDYGANTANEAAVATLVKSWNPDFVITTGDNNYLYGEAATIDQNIGQYYHQFIFPYGGTYGAGSPDFNRFFPALGNHDWNNVAGAAPYLAYFSLPGNERYYDFGWGPLHLFALDSDPHEPDGVDSASVQAAWLQARLAAVSEPWKIVYMHHPPYSSSSVHGSTGYMQWDFQGWGASAVLAGHDHTYERIAINGFPYFVNGLGGQTLYSFGTPVTGSQLRYNDQYGAMLIDATAAQLTFQFIGVDGTVADTFTLP